MPEPTFLICAPADSPLMARGSSYDHHCSRCGGRVLIAPSGIARLKRDPAMKILCLKCYQPKDDDTFEQMSPDTLAEFLRPEPNPWRYRN